MGGRANARGRADDAPVPGRGQGDAAPAPDARGVGRLAGQPAPRRLLYIINNGAFFVSHRLALGTGARAAGYEVHLACPPWPGVAVVEAAGIRHHPIALSRSGANPLVEARSLFALWQLMRMIAPDVVHLVTIKPVIYGGIAARLAGVPRVVAAISGLGFAFIQRGIAFTILRGVISVFYRLALGHPGTTVVFQNSADRDTVVRIAKLPIARTTLIRGSGVDLAVNRPVPRTRGEDVVVTMASRLLRDKGVVEYVDAARRLRGTGVNVRFLLAGDPDPGNPATVTAGELAEWRQLGIVELLGHCDDVNALFAASDVVVLPSYREGMPKVLLEAAACGRAVVTTDVPGCRDAIDPEVTGILVPARDPTALANAIERLARDATLRARFGAAGRALAEREFDLARVVEAHLQLYNTQA